MTTKAKRLRDIYVFVIGFSIIPVLILTKPHIQPEHILGMLFWIILIVIAEFKPIMIPRWNQVNEITVSFVPHLSAIFLIGPEKSTWIAVLATLVVEAISRRAWYKALFNAGQYGLTVYISGLAFYWLKSSPGETSLNILADLPAVLLASSIYIFLNTFFISTVISLSSGKGPLDMFPEDLKFITGYFYSLVPVSVVISKIYSPKFPFTVLIMIPPLMMADYGLRKYYSLHKETYETLNVLANIIDERDKYTAAHSLRVAQYAREISTSLGLPQSLINEIETAGLVHDLGKIGVEDRILRKEGKLTEEEYAEIKKHPEIAYRLLVTLKPYKEGAKYVLYHHERVDGKGYPRGLSGKSIPLGARILAVADSFDAMTSNRPYRSALTKNSAAKELKKHSGTQFDPDVVETFIKILENSYDCGEE